MANHRYHGPCREIPCTRRNASRYGYCAIHAGARIHGKVRPMEQYRQERLVSYEERDNAIVELYEFGLTLKQIGECVGVVPGAVFYVLQKKGLR